MAVDQSGLIEESFQNSGTAQLANLWDFYFDGYELIKFRVLTSSLPFPKFTHHTRSTGEKVYQGVEHIETVTLQFREDVDWTVYTYFKDWMGLIINEDREFSALSENTPKGSEDDFIHRNGTLTFFSSEDDEDKVVELTVKEFVRGFGTGVSATEDIVSGFMENYSIEKEKTRSKTNTFLTKEIIQNLLTSAYRRTRSQITRQINNRLTQFNRVAGFIGVTDGGRVSAIDDTLDPPPTKRNYTSNFQLPNLNLNRVDFGVLKRKLDERVAQVRKQKLRERETKSFVFHNMKPLGIQPLDLDYTNAEPVTLSIDFVVDTISSNEEQN